MSIAISRKLGALLSFGFIVGMCVLLGQAEPPTTDVSIAEPAASVRLADPAARSSAADRFELTSVVSPMREATDTESTGAEPIVPIGGEIARSELPPLHDVQDSSPPAAAMDAPSRRPPPLLLVALDRPSEGAMEGDAFETPEPETKQPGSPAADERRPAAKSHVVVKGDTLVGICKTVYGRDDLKTQQMVMQANPSLKKRRGMVLLGETLNLPPDAQATSAGPAARQPAAAAKRGTGRSNSAEPTRTSAPKSDKLPKSDARRRARTG